MNLKNCFTIFCPIDEEYEGRFLAGEIEASQGVCATEVERIKTYTISNTRLKEGRTYENRGEGIVIGTMETHGATIPIVSEATDVTIISKTGDILTIMERSTMGTARVISSTGLKGVLKPITELGMATVDLPNEMPINIPVDLITGPNAVKTDKGTNSIQLAKATAAILYGLSDKYDMVDSQDEKQVNELAALWPDCVYEGKTYPCGILQIQATEIGADYAKLKPLVFSFVMLKYLQEDGHNDLFEAIIDEGRDETVVNPILELYRCYRGVKEGREVMPPARLKKLINLADLPSSNIQDFPPEGWLFSEENTGFLIRAGSAVLRIPDGALMSADSAVMHGRVMVGAITLAVARLIRDILTGRNLSYKSVTHPANQFTNAMKSVLFSTTEASENRASEMIKPRLLGINLKQIAEARLPIDVIAVPDRIYYKMRRKVFGKETPIDGEEMPTLHTLSCRNPALWRMQLRNFKTISISMANEEYGCNMMENAYMVAMSPYAMMEARSDCDGDLLPIFILRNQEALNKETSFKALFTTDEEKDWIAEYAKGEYKQFKPGEYKLHDIPWQTYRGYLLDANLTKTAVGSATNDSWAFQFLLEAYSAEYKMSGGVIIHQEKQIKLRELSKRDAIALYSVFIFLLQDNVISGIKHSSGGSNVAKEFSLELMDKSKAKLLEAYNLDPRLVSLMFYILEWGRKRKYTPVVKKFLRLANKGIHPKLEPGEDDRFVIFQERSLLGQLTKPLRDVDAIVEAETAAVGMNNSDLF